MEVTLKAGSPPCRKGKPQVSILVLMEVTLKEPGESPGKGGNYEFQSLF